MNTRLVVLLNERRKAIAGGLASVVLSVVYVVSGVNLDPALALSIAGVVVGFVVERVANVPAA
jgi:hypothetical protein